MDQYMTIFKKYLDEHQPNFGYADVDSILEMFYNHYIEWNPMDNDRGRKLYQKLDQCLQKLDLQNNDRVFDIVADMCWEYQHLAFLEGLRVGLRVAAELWDDNIHR